MTVTRSPGSAATLALLDEDDGWEVIPAARRSPSASPSRAASPAPGRHGRVPGLYIGRIPDRLQVREDGTWHDVPLLWTDEQDGDGEFAAVPPLAHRGKARTECGPT
ncbi:hypothetical protein [Streptomyces paradoxus]|uniref:hypothetical protein n=1 Tax=Streptomyces paradoxus TaxID=66375 RepID=UPI00381B294D